MTKKVIIISVAAVIVIGVSAILIAVRNQPAGSGNLLKEVTKKTLVNLSEPDDFLRKYCREESNLPMWSCSTYSDYKNIYTGTKEQFVKECEKRGYHEDFIGMSPGDLFRCYRFTDEGKTCSDFKDCGTQWCRPVDEACQNNCAGTCSGVYGPGECGESKQKRVEIIDGKVVSKEVGGGNCIY